MRTAMAMASWNKKIACGKQRDWCGDMGDNTEEFKGCEEEADSNRTGGGKRCSKRPRDDTEINIPRTTPKNTLERSKRDEDSKEFQDLHRKYQLLPTGKDLPERERKIWTELEKLSNKISKDDIADSSQNCYAAILSGVQSVLRNANLLTIVDLHTVSSHQELIALFTTLSTRQGKVYQCEEGKLKKKSMMVLRAALRRTIDARGVDPSPLDNDEFQRFWKSLKRGMITEPCCIKESVEGIIVWRMAPRLHAVLEQVEDAFERFYLKRKRGTLDECDREKNTTLLIALIMKNTSLFVEFQTLLAIYISFFGIRRQTEVRSVFG